MKEKYSEKNLGLKVGTEEEKFWTDLSNKLKEDNKNYQRQTELNKMILVFSEKKIKQCQRAGKESA